MREKAPHTGGARKMRKDDMYFNAKRQIKHKKYSEGQINSKKHVWRNMLTCAFKELRKCDAFKKVQLFSRAVLGLARAKRGGRHEAYLKDILKESKEA